MANVYPDWIALYPPPSPLDAVPKTVSRNWSLSCRSTQHEHHSPYVLTFTASSDTMQLMSQKQRRQIVIHFVQISPTKKYWNSSVITKVLRRIYPESVLSASRVGNFFFFVWVGHTVKNWGKSGLRKFYILTECSKIIQMLYIVGYAHSLWNTVSRII